MKRLHSTRVFRGVGHRALSNTAGRLDFYTGPCLGHFSDYRSGGPDTSGSRGFPRTSDHDAHAISKALRGSDSYAICTAFHVNSMVPDIEIEAPGEPIGVPWCATPSYRVPQQSTRCVPPDHRRVPQRETKENSQREETCWRPNADCLAVRRGGSYPSLVHVAACLR